MSNKITRTCETGVSRCVNYLGSLRRNRVGIIDRQILINMLQMFKVQDFICFTHHNECDTELCRLQTASSLEQCAHVHTLYLWCFVIMQYLRFLLFQ